MGDNRIDWRQLGNRVAEMRIERGLTQMDLAEMTGLSVTYVGYLEQGKRHGKFETYLQLVTVMGYVIVEICVLDHERKLFDDLEVNPDDVDEEYAIEMIEAFLDAAVDTD